MEKNYKGRGIRCTVISKRMIIEVDKMRNKNIN